MSQPAFTEADRRHMARALELARRGEGYVEPNPMVGCVLVRGDDVVGEGWHQRFGDPHAEVEALTAAGSAAHGATAYVTLEPCAHTGKTPPCTEALIAARVARVVIACRDPHPVVDGRGLARLEAAAIRCDVGLLAEDAQELIAPFAKLARTGRPWVIAKWAMTLDGKIASSTGDSRWISNEQSRAVVHKLRSRVDAVIVGQGTVAADDPLLTARPPGPRTPARVVLDSQARLAPASRLVETLSEGPVIVAASNAAPPEHVRRLADLGVEVWQSSGDGFVGRWRELLDELGRRQMTNVLVEGGAKSLGTLLDAEAIDEVHAFIAPKIIGGGGPGAIAGTGLAAMSRAAELKRVTVEQFDGDVYIRGRLH